MDKKRIRELAVRGWQVGSVGEFLGLSGEEAAYIELKLILSQMVRELREKQGLTQSRVAEELGSSQSRISKIEGADPSVSIDLQIRSLLALGATRGEIGKMISGM